MEPMGMTRPSAARGRLVKVRITEVVNGKPSHVDPTLQNSATRARMAAMEAGKFRRSKYGAIRTTVDGIMFASKAEARRYGELKLMEKAGKIHSLVLQPSYKITLHDVLICRVVLDFKYIERGFEIIEDVKGRDLPLSRLKRKLFEAMYGISVKLIRYGR
jgi:hypothetical protein